MKSLKLFAVLALCMSFAGCDINAFTEDFDDAQLTPPYVAFDRGQLDTAGWAYSAANDALGSTRTVASSATVPVSAGGLRVRLPVAIGEDVTVTYALSGTAQRGVHYEVPGGSGGNGQLVINYADQDDTSDATSAPWYRNLPITILPRPAGQPAVTLTLDLVSATAPSGRNIVIGRYPNNRDNRATLTIAPTPAP
ncbi:hypothetical protein BH23BAC4_BH23BAC4_09910 [soil metagenome]